MTQEKWRSILRVLGVFLSLLCMILIASLIYLWHNKGGEEKSVSPKPTVLTATTPVPGVTNRENMYVDAEALLRRFAFSLSDPDGQSVALSDFTGSPVALSFFASYCPDCQRELQDAQTFLGAAEAQGGAYRLVARLDPEGRETREAALSYARAHEIKVPVLLDENAAVYQTIGLHWIPTTLFFNPGGVLMNAVSVDTLTEAGFAARMRYAAEGGRPQTARFVLSSLTTETGAVAANFTISSQGAVTPSDEVLSESMGMLMEYALAQDDAQLFETCFAYIDRHLTVNGLNAWRVQGGQRADTNATVDDLRILSGLMRAEAMWGADYAEAIKTRSDALYRSVVVDDKLVDHSTLDGDEKSDKLTLCYVDAEALSLLAETDDRWRPVHENAVKTLQAGLISVDFPLFYPRFDYASGAYSGSYLQMNEACVTLLHLAEAGLLPPETVSHVKDMLRAGPLYALYDWQGNVMAGYAYESTATYALLIRVGLEIEDEDLMRLSLWRMEMKRNFEHGSLLDGLYAVQAAGETHYAFDLLTVMQAWSSLDDFLRM